MFDENGELLIIAHYTKEELRQMKGRKFYCLRCQEEIILKVGERKRAHFAHYPSIKSKKIGHGESVHHIFAKTLLYEHFTRLGKEVKLEFFLKSINQQPDLLIKNSRAGDIAFEFQASNLSLTRFRERTLALQRNGFIPIWILSNKLLNMKGENIIKVTDSLLQFMHQTSTMKHPQLYFFNPDKKLIIVLEHIFILSSKRAYVQKRLIPLNKMSSVDFFYENVFQVRRFINIWRKTKKHDRLRVRKKAYGAEADYRTWLYEKGFHFDTLPAVINLPTVSSFMFKIPPINWQSRIYLQVIDPLPINSHFTYDDCLTSISPYLKKLHDYPLIIGKLSPINSYLKLLINLKIIVQSNKTTYKKIKASPQMVNIEKALIADDDIINELLYNLR